MRTLFKEFDTSQLKLLPLADRKHNLDLSCLLPLRHVEPNHKFKQLGKKIIQAKQQGAAVVLMMGAHVLRDGVQHYIIDLIEKGYISCIACNGAGVIHDFEFSLIGATTESVARYIKNGQFGLWQETGIINDIVTNGASKEKGLGESVGEYIEKEQLPYSNTSILAAAWRCRIPVTVHIGIGYDIIHEHPNFNPAAHGQASYRDFLRFTKILENLSNGVLMNFGSAVMAPEVYLKALAMVRNVATQKNEKIANFTTLVCDLKELPYSIHHEACRNDPSYYFRPWKTMLVRTLSEKGKSYYVQGKHSSTFPQLWSAIIDAERTA